MYSVVCFFVSAFVSFVAANGRTQALFLPTILRNFDREASLKWKLPEFSENLKYNSAQDGPFEMPESGFSQYDDSSEEEDTSSEAVETSWVIDPEWFMVEDSLMSALDTFEDVLSDYDENIVTPTETPDNASPYTELYDPSWKVVEHIVDGVDRVIEE